MNTLFALIWFISFSWNFATGARYPEEEIFESQDVNFIPMTSDNVIRDPTIPGKGDCFYESGTKR